METTTFDERQAGTFTRRGVTFHRTWFDRNVYGGTIGFCTDNGVPALRRTFAAEGAEISVQAGYVVASVTLAP